jgi:hypothetical protein
MELVTNASTAETQWDAVNSWRVSIKIKKAVCKKAAFFIMQN